MIGKFWKGLKQKVSAWRTRSKAVEHQHAPRSHVEHLPVLVPGASPDYTYRRAFVATLIGVVIIARDHVPGLHELFAPLDRHFEEAVTHVGIAFLVSAIVTFAYEWGSESKRTAALTAELVNVLDTHVERVLAASDREAITNAMSRLSRDDQRILAPQFLDFADAIGRLAQGDWAAPAYLAFIRRYHKELTEKAQLLAEMSKKLRDDPHAMGAEFRVPMPNAVVLADTIVQSTLEQLAAKGGRYYAVSDAATWKRLTGFRGAHSRSLERVKTQRIFVLGRDTDHDILPADVTGIIYSHFKEARESSGQYEIKITTADEYLRRRVVELSDAMHFGIFAPDQGAPIAFLVIDERLSNFRITAASEEMLSGFGDLWRQFDDLSEDPVSAPRNMTTGEAILQDYLLAYRIKRMPPGALYRGVSLAWSWCEGVLERFFKASHDAIEKSGVRVRRIFVFDDRADTEGPRILDVIARHAELAAARPQYEWRVCHQSELKNLRPGLAIFEGGSERGEGQVMDEVSVGPGIFDARPRTFHTYSKAFDEFWSTLDFETSVRNVFGSRTDEILKIVQDARDRHTSEADSP